MKRLALALFAAAGLATTAARADRVDIRGSVNIGGPVYSAPAPGYYRPAPVYVAPPAHGYWREVTVPVLIPGRWVTTHDRWGRHVRVWEPPHHEYRRERVWVDAYANRGGHPGHGNGYGRWNG